ncbi:hypothetical protein SISNIDRAFT_221513 [Sistotremastrum niveocremeum HHB9708]|uniref:BRCT domain-containing protein n=1 Tax=Sistotremastrum niveocremeum HHB9708 TaxID=1314777 RepID=A0A164QMM9_9AGAM|nr:hypothetical protein SISNIDRAFT_221513 [Sistotremastrum niveocremeum HHB9708]
MVEKIFLRIINGVDFPIKFYIHDELDDARSLKKTIEKYGGRVIPEIPFLGFVVVDPETPNGRKLARQWNNIERKDRFFVKPTYVTKCIEEEELLDPRLGQHTAGLAKVTGKLLQSKGKAMRVFIDDSVTGKARKALRSEIKVRYSNRELRKLL